MSHDVLLPEAEARRGYTNRLEAPLLRLSAPSKLRCLFGKPQQAWQYFEAGAVLRPKLGASLASPLLVFVLFLEAVLFGPKQPQFPRANRGLNTGLGDKQSPSVCSQPV